MLMGRARGMLSTVKSMDTIEELRCRFVILVVNWDIEVS